MYILGISCYYHDASACLVEDGRVIAAAAEERFTRIKHDNNFPTNAIDFCLRWAEITAKDLTTVVFYEKPILKFDRTLRQHLQHFPKSRKIFVDTINSWFDLKLRIPTTLKKKFSYTGPVSYIEHHLSHAASSYYLSGFDEAAIVTIDGVGEWATTTMGYGNGMKIRIDRQIHFPHSLGLLYSAITSYLGFSVNDAEYKVMGLAAYGDSKPCMSQMDKLITTFSDGSYALTMHYFDYSFRERMFNKNLENLFGYPARKPESPMERHYENIAASLQKKLEDVVFQILHVAYKTYRTKNLCLAGGVALNSVMNGKIVSKTPFRNVYITPDPGDGGGAMGAALAWWHAQPQGEGPAEGALVGVPFFASSRSEPFISPYSPLRQGHDAASKHHTSLRLTRSLKIFTPFLGPSFSEEQIEDILKHFHLSYSHYPDRDKLLDLVSTLLTRQKIIGWFAGRMEWGPRALGNRSILASAAKEEMKDIINSKVKHRELFRPFAPVVLDRFVKDYFKTDTHLSPSVKYMLMVYPFTEKGKRDAPATVHVDGSGRLQVIERADNPLYYDLIETYRKKTGIPIIINTSFNVRAEPIVCTPTDAVNCFLKTDIDYLVMGSFVVKK